MTQRATDPGRPQERRAAGLIVAALRSCFVARPSRPDRSTRRGDHRARLRRLAAGALRLSALGRRARRRPSHDPGRARAAGAVPAAGGALHRRGGDLPDALRALYRLHRLEPELARAAAHFNGLDNSADALRDPYFWNALGNMVFYVLAVLVRVRDRLRARPAAQRRDPGAQVLPRRLPAALHAEPGRRELDDRQVAHGIPLRPGGHAGALLGWDNPAFFASPWIARSEHRWRWMPGFRFPS